ncbi:unnamed protein product [Rotaria magnacalcarata]|uniref:Nudix hydrolase domain-containing protein n=3 Tax=Rotaria magnacalcarata TaxID=392030 RepID=A0A815YC42_9BILA|nr:unnamed protein product [Rotaria magnacalcarata]CAF1568189.1 unnamed protein product [Rotaria magnacalcarata]CAF2030035.1 unnamed protein product [Rotaria magnacalcarata]CAF2079651.1 unnamed protein product [Rotaria magnacalcarata]CAF3815527.1 unnamed protein product [Rotaria magnacalcarata]
MTAVENVEAKLLTGCSDMYSGITVDKELLAKTSVLFEHQLEQSLIAWREAKRRGIWLPIPHDRTELIPIAQKFGFVLHHAKPDYVMLTYWLDENEPNQLPSYAISTIGVGGLVVNSKREVLLIQERFAYVDDYFKLPGGALDIGEPIECGVEREVFEETGVRAHFRGVLAFTYDKNFRFEHGDVYFVCLMSLDENEKDQKINFDPLEIAACQWMSLDEWANSPEKHPVPITLHLARLTIDVLDGREKLLEPDLIKVRPKNPKQLPWNIMMYRKKSSEKNE